MSPKFKYIKYKLLIYQQLCASAYDQKYIIRSYSWLKINKVEKKNIINEHSHSQPSGSN
jgi:hypothetical protein